MPCLHISAFIQLIGNKCLEKIGLNYKPERKPLVISSPYDFKEGPAVNFPGYSQDDISLMKEKAIASTAVTEDEHSDRGSEFEFGKRRVSRVGSMGGGIGIGRRVAMHARRVSGSLREGRDFSW